MPVYYFDTSAILKRYRNELGTDVVDRLFDSPQGDSQFYISFLTILELTSSILRLVKGGQLSQSVADDMLARFSQDIPDTFRLAPLTDAILNGAVTVVGRHQLRSGDAIHLATASSIFSLAPESEGILVSSDSELLSAAANSGMGVLNPQDSDLPSG
jgi:predicted nucleic acid-binding protein